MKTRANFIVLLICSFLFWAVWVALQVNSIGYGAEGLIDLFVLALMLLLFVTMAFSLRSKNWQVPLHIGLILGTYFCSIFPAEWISRWQWRASIQAAQPLIGAVEAFHQAKGKYPDSIQELIPAYLPAEPRTKMGLFGEDFGFTPDPDGFRLTFNAPWSKWWTYDSTSKQWTMGD